MSEIIWQDPETRAWSGGAPIDARRVAMDANPGRWLLWGRSIHASTATRLRREGYEAVSRKNPNGKWDVYARRPEGWKP